MRTVRRRAILLAAAVPIDTAASLLLQPFRDSGLTSCPFDPHSVHAPTDRRAIDTVVIRSNANGEAAVTWNPPSETAHGYRIFWNEVVREGFPVQ